MKGFSPNGAVDSEALIFKLVPLNPSLRSLAVTPTVNPESETPMNPQRQKWSILPKTCRNPFKHAKSCFPRLENQGQHLPRKTPKVIEGPKPPQGSANYIFLG